MEKFIIELKDVSKRSFLLELLSQLDFIDLKIREEAEGKSEPGEDYNFFQSAGLFAKREIDAKEAWRK